MNAGKQDELLKQFKSGVLSFCCKYYSENTIEFNQMLLPYINGYNLDKLSNDRREQASSYLSGILDTFNNIKYRIKYE